MEQMFKLIVFSVMWPLFAVSTICARREYTDTHRLMFQVYFFLKIKLLSPHPFGFQNQYLSKVPLGLLLFYIQFHINDKDDFTCKV